jgi:Flp pilus assembly protein TadB
VQIVIAVSVGMALALAMFDHAFLAPYDGLLGQLVLVIVAAIYAAGILWLRRLARFEVPQRLLTATSTIVPTEAAGVGGAA